MGRVKGRREGASLRKRGKTRRVQLSTARSTVCLWVCFGAGFVARGPPAVGLTIGILFLPVDDTADAGDSSGSTESGEATEALVGEGWL